MKSQQVVLGAAWVLSTAVLFTQAEVIHAVVAIQREGDRTWRGRLPTHLTVLGEAQSFESGAFYRQRYIESTSENNIVGISQTEYSSDQVYAIAPDQPLLVTTAQAFLQGLYPPKVYNKPIPLGNGETVIDPVNGTQYTTVHTISSMDPNTIWLNADDNCPTYGIQAREYTTSDEWARLLKESDAFYDTLNEDFLKGVFQNSEIGYQSAYSIFDYLNVGRIHNATIASKLTEAQWQQLKSLADQHEWALHGRADADKPAIVIAGRAIAYKVLTQLMANVMTAGTQGKFTLLASSYDTFLGFFGLSRLSDRGAGFMTLPDYASSMVFELFSDGSKTDIAYPKEDALKVRFFFKNGTQALTQWPIFGTATSLPLKTFREKIAEIAIKSHWEWCAMCSSGELFCPEPTKDLIGDPRQTIGNGNADNGNETENDGHAGGSRITPTVAGVIGAVIAFVVSLLALGVAIALFGLRFKRNSRFSLERGFKGGEKLDSQIDLTRLTVPPPATVKL
ncbi:histidine phosphatase superfamily [Peziza echinospora]|nr:histidine phosphatase superfamily [Peziza echinospora]